MPARGGMRGWWQQVRRKADSAKGLVKDWLTTWRDNKLVATSSSHREIKSENLPAA